MENGANKTCKRLEVKNGAAFLLQRAQVKSVVNQLKVNYGNPQNKKMNLAKPTKSPLYWLLKAECVKRHTSLPLLAKQLNISPTALYVAVAGKKHFPDKWRQQIIAIWHLNAQEQLALQEAIALSQPYIKLDLRRCNNPLLRKCASAFARNFDNMSNETAEKILELLNNHVLA